MNDEEPGGAVLKEDANALANDEAAGAKLWSVYISEAEKYDQALVESWKSDMEGMLIFAGLFSGILTAFLIESYKTLTPDAGDGTLLLLAQISQQLSGIANGSAIEIIPAEPFVPSRMSLVCNALWFVSLGLSLSCALIATLVEQWAREFQHKSEMRSAPIVRARIFSYLYYGLKRFNMHVVVKVLPVLLHASLIIFFMGLIAFLVPVNQAMMILVAFLLAIMIATYFILTILPLVHLDCPYRTPLSGGLWRALMNIRQLVLSKRKPTGPPTHPLGSDVSMVDVMSEAAIRRSEKRDKRDHRALCWTVRSLADDAELEPFIEGIPDVLWSSHGRRNIYDEHLKVLLHDPEVRLLNRLEHFLRGCDSDLLSSDIQTRRRISGLKALWAIATMPRRDGLFLEPLESFDTRLLAQNAYGMPFKIAHYQVSARTVVDLNILLAVSGEIHDMTQLVLQYKELAMDGHLPPINQISSGLPHIVQKFDRLPGHLWQSSSDRESRENLVDLINNPPSGISDTSSWMAQCLGTLESLPDALLALEYEIFVAYMIDAAALESWPYEFEATRATFSFDEVSVSADMAATFSTAFDSIVSAQTRRPSYTAHADEIIAVLLAVCANAMIDDDTYYPLNLTAYLTTKDEPLSTSHVVQKCNTFWLCGCLTAELEASAHASTLLSGRVVQAMWQVAFLMAREYLDSWKYKSTPASHIRALAAVRAVAASSASPSAAALLQTTVLNAMSPLPHDFDNLEALNTVPVAAVLHSDVSEIPNPVVLTSEGTDIPGGEPVLSILTLRVVILAEFLEHCVDAEIPYNVIQTLSILTEFTPNHPGVRAAYQVRFARSFATLLKQAATDDLLRTLVGGKCLAVYAEKRTEWNENARAYRWLDDPLAIRTVKESVAEYLGRAESEMEIHPRLHMILKRIEQS